MGQYIAKYSVAYKSYDLFHFFATTYREYKAFCLSLY